MREFNSGESSTKEYLSLRLERCFFFDNRLRGLLALRNWTFLEDFFIYKDECAINGIILEWRLDCIYPYTVYCHCYKLVELFVFDKADSVFVIN